MNNLSIACEMSLNDWFETFPDIIPEAEKSKKHEKWKKNLFNKMRDDYYHRFTTKTLKIMLVAAVLSVLILTAFVIPSSRDFILDKFDTHSTYKLTENNKNSVNGEITVGYIPKDFKLDNFVKHSKHLIVEYKSNNGEFISIIKKSSAVEIDYNTELTESEIICYNGVKYVYCKGNLGTNNMIWIKNDYVYQIEAPYEKEVLLKIAITVK